MKAYQPSYWLFEGQTGCKYGTASIRSIFRKAVNDTNSDPWATTVHTLRHSFATHCIENNIITSHSTLKGCYDSYTSVGSNMTEEYKPHSKITEDEVVSFFKGKMTKINEFIGNLKFTNFKVVIEQREESDTMRIDIIKKIPLLYFSKQCKSS